MMNKKKLLALFMAVLMTLALLPTVASATEEVFYTLTPKTGSNSSYASNCDVEINNITWNITGNSTMLPWRIGGKSLNSVDRAVYSKTAMGPDRNNQNVDITKVELTVGAASGITVNSLTLIVASDKDFANTISSIDATFEANTTIIFSKPAKDNNWRNAYYKFVFNVTVSATSNRFVEFKEAKFYKESSGGTEPQPTTHTVTLDPGIASGNNSPIEYENESSPFTLPDECPFTAPAGMVFAGWKSGNHVYESGDTVSFSDDITLVAQWAWSMRLKRTIANGDVVAIYNPANSKLMSAESYYYNSTKYELKPISATVDSDNKLLVPENAAVFTVSTEHDDVNDVTYYTFKTADDQYLEIDDKNVQLTSDSDSAYIKLRVEPLNLGEADADGYTIFNDAEAKYLELYYGYFTSFSAGTTGAYRMNFFATDGEGPTPTYTVTYQGGEGATGNMDPKTVASGNIHKVLSNAFSKSGSDFVNWKVSDGDTTYSPNDEIVVTDNIVLVAQWVETQTFHVSFVANNGTDETMDSEEIIEGHDYTLPACTFTVPEGTRFGGWLVNNTVYQPNEEVTNVQSDFTATALWYKMIARDYTLVTNANQLKDGDKIIIVGKNGSNYYALSNDGGSNRRAVSVEVFSSVISVPAAVVSTDSKHAHVLELGKVTDGDITYWTFYDSLKNGYLNAASSGSNQLKTSAITSEDNMRFTLEISDDGEVYPIASNSSYRNNMRFNYNNNSPLFNCYKSDSTLPGVYIYKESTLEDGYYLIGPNWTVNDISSADKFEKNPANSSEYLLYTNLYEGNEIKVVQVQNGGIVDWYPDGLDNQYHVDAAHAGYVAICFKPNYDGNWSTFGGYMWIEKVTTPAFRTQATVLSDQIGVRFFVDLNMLTEQERNASYMTFAISGRGSVTDQNIVADSTNKKGYKGFTCKVNAIQMADTITATLHYGDGQTIEKTYSVKEYIEKWDELYPNDTSDTTKLIHALADYGHYAQLFLSSYHGWEIYDDESDPNKANKYKSMDRFYTNGDDYDEATIKSAASAAPCAMTVDGKNYDGSGTTFAEPTMALVLDSETAIRVYFSMTGTAVPTFTVVDKNGASRAFTSKKVGDKYMVEIPGVKAKQLCDRFTITAKINDDAYQTVGVSAVTYVGRMLSAGAYDNDQTAHDVVCALWNYAQLAANYNG